MHQKPLIKYALPALGFLAIAVIAFMASPDFVREQWGADLDAPLTTVHKLARAYDGMEGYDVAYYIEYAEHFKQQGNLRSWHSGFWPPGVPVVISTVTGWFGENAYARHMAWVGVLFWTACLWSWYIATSPLGHAPTRFVLINLFWLFPSFRSCAVGLGTLESESFSCALFGISLAAFASGLHDERRRSTSFSIAVLFWAAAAYFRPIFDLFGLSVLAALLGSTFLYLWVANRKGKFSSEQRNSLRLAGQCFAVFFLLTMPWKSFVQRQYGLFTMSASLNLSAETVFWNASPPRWLRTGNLPCRLDPENCRRIASLGDKVSTQEKVALATAVLWRNPGAWLSEKINHLPWFWFGINQREYDSGERRVWWWVEGIALLAWALAALWMALRKISSSGKKERAAVGLALVLFFAFVCANLPLILYLDLKPRYSLPLRLLCLWLPFIVAMARLRPEPKPLWK